MKYRTMSATQQVHDRVDLLGLAAHELDEHVHDDAGARPLVMLPVKAVNIIMTQADGFVKVREVDLREALSMRAT